jgi:hypothetical protein
MSAVLRTEATGETQGFMKALVGGSDDRILGFTMMMGTYSTLKEATESLAPRERPKTKREMRRWPSLLLPNTD